MPATHAQRRRQALCHVHQLCTQPECNPLQEKLVRSLCKKWRGLVNEQLSGKDGFVIQAARAGNVSLVQTLKECRADVNQTTRQGVTALQVAVYQKDAVMVRFLVQECGAAVNQAKPGGATALFLAAAKGDTAVVRLLVKECGAEVNQAKLTGATPLHAAVQHGHGKMAQWLVKHGGADPTAQCTEDKHPPRTAADMALTQGDMELYRRLQCARPGCTGVGAKRCSQCRTIRYCGTDCQAAHWKEHKQTCECGSDGSSSDGSQ